MKIRENQQEKIFSKVAEIIVRARARAKATEALAQDIKNMNEDFSIERRRKSMKIKRLSVNSLIIAAIAELQGCSIIPKTARTGAQVTIEDVAEILDGKTRKEDLILAFGEPSKVLEGGNIWIYSGSKTIEWLGVPFGGGKRLVIVFDKAGTGLVQKHSFRKD